MKEIIFCNPRDLNYIRKMIEQTFYHFVLSSILDFLQDFVVCTVLKIAGSNTIVFSTFLRIKRQDPIMKKFLEFNNKNKFKATSFTLFNQRKIML